MINILSETKIAINPFFWLVIVGAILTGQFLEIITLFGIVIIHELGHVFAARSYDWKVTEIQLLPFGGVAKVEQATDSLWQEFIVAIAGPFQNLMMILVAIVFERLHLWSNDWTTFFIQANTWIGLFNLLPISPLDGGKLMKIFFYIFLSFRKAIHTSIFLSLFLSVIFLIWGSGFGFSEKMNINGLILAIFFIYINWMDAKQLPYHFWQFLLMKVQMEPMRNVAAIPIIVHQDTTVMQALRLLRKQRYHLFYLLSNNGEVIRVLPEEKVLQTIYQEKELYQPIHHIL
ncbi:MAG: M50 family metallopeptidase [Tepidibacillus sp.]|uniref:M50 family metallopeptidase n=1 Tax=Tepidibacillus sp. HK-1 TaxID=1883407 RepID=UPI000858E6A1|nr:M50 family metallopeptidase [Tepidibacillus sp. HK-1]GBF10002.1 stage IV sporulation protein FB [Tepidibacillus sp. HK-1]